MNLSKTLIASSDSNTVNSSQSDFFLDSYCQKCFKKIDNFSFLEKSLHQIKLAEEKEIERDNFSERRAKSLESLDGVKFESYRHDLLDERLWETNMLKQSFSEDKVYKLAKTNLLCFPFRKYSKLNRHKTLRPSLSFTNHPSSDNSYSYSLLNKLFYENEDQCLIHDSSNQVKSEKCVHGREVISNVTSQEQCFLNRNKMRSKSLCGIQRLLDSNTFVGTIDSKSQEEDKCKKIGNKTRNGSKSVSTLKFRSDSKKSHISCKKSNKNLTQHEQKSFESSDYISRENTNNFSQKSLQTLPNNFSFGDNTIKEEKTSRDSYNIYSRDNLFQTNVNKSLDKAQNKQNIINYKVINKKANLSDSKYEKKQEILPIGINGQRLAEWYCSSPILLSPTPDFYDKLKKPSETLKSSFSSYSFKKSPAKTIIHNYSNLLCTNFSTALHPKQEIKNSYESHSTSSYSWGDPSSHSSDSLISPLRTPSPPALENKRAQFKHSSSTFSVCDVEAKEGKRIKAIVTTNKKNEEIKICKGKEERLKVKEEQTKKEAGEARNLNFEICKDSFNNKGVQSKFALTSLNAFPKTLSMDF